jgi:hypothetical protein
MPKPFTSNRVESTTLRPAEAKSSKTSEEISAKSKATKPIENAPANGGLVDNIMNMMNENHSNMNNNAKNVNPKDQNEKKFSKEDFFGRILQWNYNWLQEQYFSIAEYQKTRELKLLEPPPLVDNRGLSKAIVVDKFNSFTEYYDAMILNILLETWEDILSAYTEKQKMPTSPISTMWLKTIDKNINDNNYVTLKVQSNF